VQVVRTLLSFSDSRVERPVAIIGNESMPQGGTGMVENQAVCFARERPEAPANHLEI
jgi:hypothetical protein